MYNQSFLPQKIGKGKRPYLGLRNKAAKNISVDKNSMVGTISMVNMISMLKETFWRLNQSIVSAAASVNNVWPAAETLLLLLLLSLKNFVIIVVIFVIVFSKLFNTSTNQ